MYAFTQISAIAVSVLGLASWTLAAPVESSSNSTLVARGPYDTHNGWTTYYNPSVGVGACGWSNSDSELVAAIGTSLYQEMMVGEYISTLLRLVSYANPNHSKACGKTAKVTWQGKSVTVKVVDRCYACGYNDIDLSPAAFQRLAALSVGKLTGSSWKFT
ncbi:Rare lipoprotein A-like double-psi beta-barrel protein [Ceratobasidium theobromae]|uniref:Rare lipoprotein A-like double-psi beta-barrel protein n=1 Tax=Ceratobasidium theobromae TaxID=1582974 RepID=A0A5N5Q7P4_9AGAM|nr:Rare lipoprotein A-like double-psi beta-barrel protein [Ceratobasidium theobromae]